MKKLLLFILFVVMTAFIIIATSDTKTTDTTDNRPVVATTVFPLYDIVQNVAGDDLHVQLVLPAGASPHTFEPTPSLLRDLEGTDVVYAIGHGIDDWSSTISESLNAEIKIVDDDIALRDSDPHYWLTFENAKRITQTITNDLSTRFPQQSQTFEENSLVYLVELEEAQEEAKRIVAEEIADRNIVALHDAWYYFADSLGINIVGTFEPSAGTEPTPQYLIALMEAIDSVNANTLYAEPQLSTQSLDAFLSDNGLTIATLDPLGGNENLTSYINMMLSNVQTIADNQ